MTVQTVPIDHIIVAEDRQRQLFPDKEMQELSDSIGDKGLFAPILVRPTGDKYTLVAGERRLRAIAAFTEPYTFGDMVVEPGHIPAVVKFFKTDMDAEEAELHENVVRLGLTWQEKANAVARLHEYHLRRNPMHRVGETASLVEEDDGKDRDYPRRKTYHDVQESLFVQQYMEDPEVAKARTLRDAAKIASRKLEQEQLTMLRTMKIPEAQPETNGSKPSPSLPSLPTGSTYTQTLYIGDMREEMKKVKDKSIHLVITDPPYGMGVDKFDDGGNHTLKHEYSEEDFRELHIALIEQMDRVCNDNAHAYIFCDIDFFHELHEYMLEAGWWARRRPLVWSKGTGKMADGTAQGFSSSYELILFAKRGTRPSRGVMPDVLRIQNERGRVHAAQKPVALYDTLIHHSTIPGDTVLDAFAGSGTIFRTEEPVNVIGIEKKEEFANWCQWSIDGKKVEGDVGEEE